MITKHIRQMPLLNFWVYFFKDFINVHKCIVYSYAINGFHSGFTVSSDWPTVQSGNDLQQSCS